MGCRAIAVRLNSEGVISQRGEAGGCPRFGDDPERRLHRARRLESARHGEVPPHRQPPEVERDGCGKRRLEWNAPEDWLIYEDAHEALIDRVTFERAQRLMKERGEQAYATGFLTGKAKVSRYLLSGLLQCGVCGGSMHGRTVWKSKLRKDGSRVGTSYYVCGASITKGKSICQPVQFLQGPMDDS